MATGRQLALVTLCHLLCGLLAQQDWAAQLRGEMDPARIEDFLRILTDKPHLAGTQDGHDLADYVRRTWLEQGLDSAHIAPYDVLLSYPHPDRPSYVALLDESGNEIFRSSPGEPPLDVDPPANISSVVPPFAAYSPSGVVEGTLVYVNYGRSIDFDTLDGKGISVEGKIAIARYGRTPRGRKLRRAQDRGAIGLIVYSDPKEVLGRRGTPYPDGWYAPGTAVQRGHFLYGTGEGEPLTPGYPATGTCTQLVQTVPGRGNR
ncbi:glutamate carboxypeptidase 2-like [Branchiostoma floridae x Branchiostoma japonicum]